MNISEFEKSLALPLPPSALSSEGKVLWYIRKGDWEAAHEIAQNIHTKAGSWLHGYLHWMEGDISNAKYWYRVAGETWPAHSQDEELEKLLEAFI